ncbi:hypothetical protein D9V61_02445 [Buchnera aphidicola (Acyrthosiphon lactucae)]|uniref:DNA polymerase III tau subunit domain-containing protein n=1 Tax=Buchnera aphidicola (Acyrthosiphon lactucae) TaxID=1241832 RepID=A0A4D6XM92_9GAMM|nr:DNA polymerase III subunit gamma/tau C-terminal domain-containing protein [Buchnera aphidicola]QCI17863.1 hypothetical protein D9V61_02445 [Buchnera aphidicola (Acyrthosiphon lactucae)]
MNHITNLVLKNRNELFENKKKIISLNNKINKKNHYIKKINLLSNKNNYQLQFLKNNKIIIRLKEKIKKIDPWYAEICKLKKLPIHVKQLAMHTSYKNTLNYWYIYLTDKKKHLMQYNTWIFLKKELHTITTKKIQLIVEEKKEHILTPYEWFHKIYKEKISEEYSSLKKDTNIKILKKFFNLTFQKNNINLFAID